MDLICHHAASAGRPVLQVSGEIDLSTIPAFHDHLTRIIGEHPGSSVLVDLDGVTTLDDTGLGMLLGSAGRAREQGGDLVLVSSNERLLERFALTGLDRAVTVQTTL